MQVSSYKYMVNFSFLFFLAQSLLILNYACNLTQSFNHLKVMVAIIIIIVKTVYTANYKAFTR